MKQSRCQTGCSAGLHQRVDDGDQFAVGSSTHHWVRRSAHPQASNPLYTGSRSFPAPTRKVVIHQPRLILWTLTCTGGIEILLSCQRHTRPAPATAAVSAARGDPTTHASSRRRGSEAEAEPLHFSFSVTTVVRCRPTPTGRLLRPQGTSPCSIGGILGRME